MQKDRLHSHYMSRVRQFNVFLRLWRRNFISNNLEIAGVSSISNQPCIGRVRSKELTLSGLKILSLWIIRPRRNVTPFLYCRCAVNKKVSRIYCLYPFNKLRGRLPSF